MKLPVRIDPRLYDVVIFDVDGVPGVQAAIELARKLHEAAVATVIYVRAGQAEQSVQALRIPEFFTVHVHQVAEASEPSAKPDSDWADLVVTAAKLGAAPQRSVVVGASGVGVAAARDGGFASVIGVGQGADADELMRCGADAVVLELADVEVSVGDKRMSERPNTLSSYAQLIGVVGGRQPFVCLDFDGTLSEIVEDPSAAKLVDGAAQALEYLAKQCPVAVVSGRDLADIRARVGLPGLWYAGNHGFELIGPDGQYHENSAAAAAVPVLEQVAADLRDEVKQLPGALVEHTRYAIAVHYRQVAVERAGEVVAAVHRHGRRHGLRVTNGRKVVELRPDIDLDKGTALVSIWARIRHAGRVIPFYIGDDLTDEDAFDAVRFSGVGIVVRHDEDGDRRTAAGFTLKGPGEVCEFLRRGGAWLAYQRQTATRAWTYTFDGYDPHEEKLREALCTVGNGFFATRGAAPEAKAGQVHYPGTYAAGVYNRLEDLVAGRQTDHESLVNLPNWLPLTFRIDGGD
jgi:alpha,alpha-trehalase